jgi:hypothetical protein
MAGTASIRFTGPTTAVLRYTIGSHSGEKSIVRQPFGSATAEASPRLVVNDLWWATEAENGWGINIAQSGNQLFAVWYTYGADGRATWMVVPGGTWNGSTFSGLTYATTGSPWLGTSYDASRLVVSTAGMMSLTFLDANAALMRYAVNGVAQTKLIYRQPF